MGVSTVLLALSDRLPDYELIRDCIAGQRQIKRRRTKYLPDPDEGETDAEARKQRYEHYLARAVFYGVTARTLRGLVGMVFDKDPAVVLPAQLELVRADATGGGLSLDQQAKATLTDVVALGRAGLLTDYPRTAGPTTRQQQLEGNVRPTIVRFKPEDIINWRTRTIGAKVMLSLVVLRESYILEDDGFAEKTGTQYRVLRLDENNVYQVEIHRDFENRGLALFETYTPRDGRGQPFREIPFTFVGVEDNEWTVDHPPLLDIAELNIAHYRNSADYEESLFVVGQATPVYSGLTKQWVDEVFKGSVRWGSRSAVLLPVGGKAELLQASENPLAMEGMKHKEDQMIALGAKLLEASGTQQTATEASLDAVMDTSVLGSCARNVSAAYRKALGWALQYLTGEFVDNREVLDFELNSDVASRTLTAADRQQIVTAWVQKAITFEEMRWNLKRTGLAYEDDEVAKEAIASETEASLAMVAEFENPGAAEDEDE